MENELLQYRTFAAVMEPLRSYNRVKVLMNLLQAGKEALATEYYNQFSAFERGLIDRMARDIRHKGEEYMRVHMLNITDFLYGSEGYDEEVNRKDTNENAVA